MDIRPATVLDVSRIVELSELKRTEYAAYGPVFWRIAERAAEKQAPFFKAQLERENTIVLVAAGAERVEGFVIGSIVAAPPVYDPGGMVCMVDDFTVSSPGLWQSVGQALLAAVTAQAKAHGAVLSGVVCGHLDEPMRSMLVRAGSAIASEWYVGPIA